MSGVVQDKVIRGRLGIGVSTRSAFLVCHAHLDPVWLWEWEEGLGAALATFRSAADLCERSEGFVFNQNEALLYEWVEEYEPALFDRIRKLVKAGRWQIMGGWYLQPDCNLPSGESMCRQIERGQAYFQEKFGVRPTTAINFDSFGHSRGLVQILTKHGYDSYLICRPDNTFCPLPKNVFEWEGFDGSRVVVRRIPELYNSPLGKAKEYIEKRLAGSGDEIECVLWGVGNHGGGPSRKDLADLGATEGTLGAWSWQHTTPENYFSVLAAQKAPLPVVTHDLNRWAVGCYTSQVRIKQGHRALENELFRAEKMAAAAAVNGLVDYPANALRDAERDLLISEFHDILPGSSIQAAEEAALRLLGHGREIVARVAARSFFSLLSGQPLANEGTYPVFVFNPHPYEWEAEIDVEFQMENQNWNGTFFDVAITDMRTGTPVPSQVEKEASNMPLDWRKHVVFRGCLAASAISRFDLRLRELPKKPAPAFSGDDNIFKVATGTLEVAICRRSGRMLSLKDHGREYLGPEGCGLEVVRDVADSWVGKLTTLGTVEGRFAALTEAEAGSFAGVVGPDGTGKLGAVRVVEDGPVRTVVEALCGWQNSRAQILYSIPKTGSAVGVEIRMLWNEKDRAAKWSTNLRTPVIDFRGQTLFGVHDLPKDGDECAFQQWCGGFGGDRHGVLLINNGTYGGDCLGNSIRLTLQRSPAYSAHAWEDLRYIPTDRFVPRMDQGERIFQFWMIPGDRESLLLSADRLALERNQLPYSLQAFPSGNGVLPLPSLVLDNSKVLLSSLRRDPADKGWIFRLFNPTGQTQSAVVSCLNHKVGSFALAPYAFENGGLCDEAQKAIL